MIKFLRVILGSSMVLLGLLGVAVGVVAILDPDGTKLADDADPFGPPPTRVGSALQVAVFLGIAFGGGVVALWDCNRPTD